MLKTINNEMGTLCTNLKVMIVDLDEAKQEINNRIWMKNIDLLLAEVKRKGKDNIEISRKIRRLNNK